MKCGREDLLLYAVTDCSWLGQKSLPQAVKEALCGGVTFVQLRDKRQDEAALTALALELKELCFQYKVPFVINDYVKLALQVDADGVHVGQKDMDAFRVREFIGPDKILGVSVRTVEQAQRAEAAGANYLGVGALFSTGTKTDATEISLETVEAICKTVSIPVLGIGGIAAERIPQLKGIGLAGVAAVSAIFAQENIERETRKLLLCCKEVF